MTKYTYISIIIACAACILVACSSDEEVRDPEESAAQTIVLGVKEVVSPVTRADQQPGDMTFTKLKTTGFGVYGYKGTYNSASSTPTLFGASGNTPVTFYTGGTDPTTNLTIPGSWKYTDTTEGLKEWESEEKYTFFAYAPYMASNGSAPGITSVKTDATAGDPTIGYQIATDPAQSVDLLWGVRSDTGLPWTDITKGTTASAVLFTFYHALCALGVQAQVMVNQDNVLTDLNDASHLGTGIVGSKEGCKVTLKDITITPKTTALHQSATLNLNNTSAHQPLWSGQTGTVANLSLSGDKIKTIFKDPTNGDFRDYTVMTDASYDDEVTGITETANGQNVITGDNVFMLIPQAAQDYTVSINYFLTYKTGESTYHRDAQSGTATISNLELKAGVKYFIKLVFGLTSLNVTVDAVDWDDETIGTTIATENGTSANSSL